MKCAFPKELLALHVEDDLSEEDAQITSRHVLECEECCEFLEQLHDRQSLVKSLRQESMSPSAFVGMRREVLSLINTSQDALGWPVKLERLLLLGFRSHRYAVAALAIIAIVSVSLLAQMRHAATGINESAAVFDGTDTLLRPARYRDWVLLNGGIGTRLEGDHHAASGVPSGSSRNVYINPSAFREYTKTGAFPQGTVMVLEVAGSHAGKEASTLALQVSVKDDHRFDGGWGFFDFTDGGSIKPRAQALPEENGCRSCHEKGAETDHVFTQFYPVLTSARAELPPSLPFHYTAKC